MGLRNLTRISPRVVARLLVISTCMVGVYFFGAGAAFYARMRSLSARESVHSYPMVATPRAERVMVFAPHCDDETLGCAGLILQTLRNGGTVRTVMVTNGDGFRTAVEQNSRSLHVGPTDYVRFAGLRQSESMSALSSLGLPKHDTRFFGYPDRGLSDLWNEHWPESDPYRSGYTNCTRSPYEMTYDSRSTYCGADLLADIKTTLRQFRPDLVTVTHPSDDHPDHAAASAFVTRALTELRADPADRAWASRTRLRYYLIHRGDWPQPQGDHRSAPLAPPVAMTNTDSRWSALALAPAEVASKSRAIERYPSQTRLMRGFLIAFARTNELYAQVDSSALQLLPKSAGDSWDDRPPVLLDPVRDDVLRDLQGGADIRSCYARVRGDRLELRIGFRQPVSARFRYRVRIRPFADLGSTPARAIVVSVGSGRVDAAPHGSAAQLAARSVRISIPWSSICEDLPGGSAAWLALAVDTSLGGVTIDSSGVRFLQVQRQ